MLDNKKVIKHEVTYRPSLWPGQVGVSLLGFWERALNRALSNRRFACSWRGLRVTSVVEIKGLYKTKKEVLHSPEQMLICLKGHPNLQKVYNLWFPCTCAILNIRMSKLFIFHHTFHQSEINIQNVRSANLSYIISIMGILCACLNLKMTRCVSFTWICVLAEVYHN